MLTNLINNAASLRYGQDLAAISFSTDATAAIATTLTATGGGGGGTVPSGHGMTTGDFVSIANADIAGTGFWWNQIGGVASTSVNLGLPAVRSTVTTQPMTRWERFETRYRPMKVTLKNLTTLDTYEWTKGMLTRNVIKTTAAGVRSIVAGNTIWVTSSVVAIHPDLLPVSNNFLLELGFDYQS